MTAMVDATFAQQAFQGFADDAAPATATAISAATNTNFTRRAGAPWQLRVRIAQTTATATQNNTFTFILMHQVNGTGGFTEVGAQGATGVKVRYANSANFADGDNIATTDFRLGTGSGTAVAGECNEAGATEAITFPVVGSVSYTELVFSLEWGDTISHLDTIEFRVYKFGNVALDTYTVTPVVRYNGNAAPIEVVSTLIAAGGGDYTLQASWESGRQSDFVAADEIDVLECQTGTTSESFFVGGSVTDATHRRIIRAAPGHETNGDFTAGFIAASSSSNAGAIKPFDDHLQIDGIVMRAGSQTSNPMISVGGGTNVPELRVGNCLIDGEGAGLNHGINRTTTAGTDRYWNNVIRGFSAVCINCNQVDSTFYVYNNTLIGGTHGVQRFNGTVHVKNNIAQGQSTACYAGTFSSSVTNLSSDATGEIQATLDFVNAAGKDYHLAAGDTEAIGAGTDLSADAGLAFDIDFEGDSRPAGDWDIGADQTQAAAANELSGTPQAQATDGTGTMSAPASGSGAPQAGTATADGTLQHRSSATGTPQVGAAVGDGAMTVRAQLSGSPQAGAAAGDGAMQAPASMSGSPQAGAADGEGTAEVLIQLSGSPQASAATSDGTIGGETNNASGAPQAEAATSDAAMSAPASASGAPSAGAAVGAGSLQHRSSASGTPQAGAATASGAAEARIQLSGAPSAGASLSTGSLAALASTAGAVAAAAAASTGSVSVVVSMSGAAQAGAASSTGFADDGTAQLGGFFQLSDKWWT